MILFQLYLTIYSLPEGSNYTCVFPELNETSPAVIWSYGVHCPAPDVERTGYQVKGMSAFRQLVNRSKLTEQLSGKLLIFSLNIFFKHQPVVCELCSLLAIFVLLSS